MFLNMYLDIRRWNKREVDQMIDPLNTSNAIYRNSLNLSFSAWNFMIYYSKPTNYIKICAII